MPRKMVDEDTLKRNIDWNINLIATQVRHAQLAKTRAKSGYYKLAVIVCASIVEAMLHLLLRRKLGQAGKIFTGEKETYEPHALPNNLNPPDTKLVIAKQREIVVPISDNPDFGRMNTACHQHGIFNKRIFNKVDKIRKTRNKIHLQGVDHVDRSYTKRDLDGISSTMNELLILAYR